MEAKVCLDPQILWYDMTMSPCCSLNYCVQHPWFYHNIHSPWMSKLKQKKLFAWASTVGSAGNAATHDTDIPNAPWFLFWLFFWSSSLLENGLGKVEKDGLQSCLELNFNVCHCSFPPIVVIICITHLRYNHRIFVLRIQRDHAQ